MQTKQTFKSESILIILWSTVVLSKLFYPKVT